MMTLQIGDIDSAVWKATQVMGPDKFHHQDWIPADHERWKRGTEPEVDVTQVDAPTSRMEFTLDRTNDTNLNSIFEGDITRSGIAAYMTHQPGQVQFASPAGGLSSSATSLNALSASSPYSYIKDYSSFTSSATTIMPEKLGSHDSGVLPAKKYSRITRNLRWTILSVYRRLNFLVILPNLLVMVILGTSNGLFKLNPQVTATAVAANLCAAVVMRQELVINILFIMFGKCPQSFPLRIRCLAAKVYHLGGVHSGAAIAGTVWYGIYNVSIIRLKDEVAPNIKVALAVFTALLDALLLGICIFAHPGLRAKYHNWFECVHRFAGWTAIIIFWVHIILFTLAIRKKLDPMPPAGSLLLNSPPFWFLIIITLSLGFPWLHLRRVTVLPERLSEHAIRLHFTYAQTPLCAAPRFTDNPLKEWHAFAGIPEENGQGFSVLVSRAGDWTTKIIQNPPTKLWTRGMLTRGVLHVAPIFKRLVLVCTGSGVGPIMALTLGTNLNARILWSTPDPERTFGKKVVDTIYRVDPEAVVINTTISGRQDLLEAAYKLYQKSNAEAVFIISNQRVTRKLVYGLESRSIPVFAPIFDS